MATNPNPPTDTSPPFTLPPHPGNPPPEPPSAANEVAWRVYTNLLTLHVNASIAALKHDDEVKMRELKAGLPEALAGAFDDTVSKLEGVFAAHDAALDRLTTALGGLPSVGGGSGTGEDRGVTQEDVAIFAGAIKAAKGL
jgi:hypothetical protein